MSWYKPWTWADESNSQVNQRNQLIGQGDAASQFAAQAGLNYGWGTDQARQALAGLQGTALGQNSVSAEQLRQGLQQLYGQQASMAAGASPQAAALAARTAALQSGRLGMGYAGQQAIAGLQERNQAQQQYAALLQALQQQNLQATLGGRQAAITAYGGYKPEGSFLDKWGGAITGGLGAASGLGFGKSKPATASAPAGNGYGDLMNPYA